MGPVMWFLTILGMYTCVWQTAPLLSTVRLSDVIHPAREYQHVLRLTTGP